MPRVRTEPDNEQHIENQKAILEVSGRRITDAFRELLSEKHLYQSVLVKDGRAEWVDKIFKTNFRTRTDGNVTYEASQLLDWFDPFLNAWYPVGTETMVECSGDALKASNWKLQKFPLPTIGSTCNYCEANEPFNPVGVFVTAEEKSGKQLQRFWLSYQCQRCKSEPMHLLVRRSDLKLTLVGRDPIEIVSVPKFIPKDQSGYFRSAIIAHNSGQTLAGIFLLRVFVEQFWRSVPDVQKEATSLGHRATGDELGEAYKKTLPEVFRSQFPTLCEVYSDLSAAMHGANADATVFEESRARVLKHFDARRLFDVK